MADHDQRFKILLREFFAEFFQLFLPAWADRFDFTHIEWLDKEVFTDPPQGERRYLDLVAQTPTRQPVADQGSGEPENWIALVHVEIESADSVALFRSRMFDYYVHLRRQHQKPVLPIAVYLRVGLEGLGLDEYRERFWEMEVLHFQFWYVGLPALNGIDYIQGDNPLGVALAALMRLPADRRVWLRAEGLRRVRDYRGNDFRRFPLAECLQAYLPLSEAEQAEFDQLLQREPYRGVQEMGTTWYEQGLEKGQEQGQRRLLRRQLEKRFGPLTQRAQERLQTMPLERLEILGDALLTASSLQEIGLEDADQ